MCFVQDLKSTNGTFISRKRDVKGRKLAHGDRFQLQNDNYIHFGDVCCKFVEQSPPHQPQQHVGAKEVAIQKKKAPESGKDSSSNSAPTQAYEYADSDDDDEEKEGDYKSPKKLSVVDEGDEEEGSSVYAETDDERSPAKSRSVRFTSGAKNSEVKAVSSSAAANMATQAYDDDSDDDDGEDKKKNENFAVPAAKPAASSSVLATQVYEASDDDDEEEEGGSGVSGKNKPKASAASMATQAYAASDSDSEEDSKGGKAEASPVRGRGGAISSKDPAATQAYEASDGDESEEEKAGPPASSGPAQGGFVGATQIYEYADDDDDDDEVEVKNGDGRKIPSNAESITQTGNATVNTLVDSSVASSSIERERAAEKEDSQEIAPLSPTFGVSDDESAVEASPAKMKVGFLFDFVSFCVFSFFRLFFY